MRHLPLACFALIACLLAAQPAEARLGDTVTVSRELAHRHGAKSVRIYTNHPYPADENARVVAETWLAPDAGWTLDEANSFLKLIVGSKRRLMVKTSRNELGWIYTFRYQGHVTARCIYEKGKVREIATAGPDYIDGDAVEEKTITFTFSGD